MEEIDIIPVLAQAPLKPLDEHYPESIIINGYSVSVENYLDNPQKFNEKPINQLYLKRRESQLSQYPCHIIPFHINN